MERIYRHEHRPTFTLVQLVSGLAGALFLIVGLVVMIRTGLTFESTPRTEVLGLAHTSLLGMIEAFVGLILLLIAASRDRTGTIFMGAVLAIFGVILLIEPERLINRLGTGEDHGIFYLITGVLLLGVGMFAPTVRRERVASAATVHEGRDVVVERRVDPAAPVDRAVVDPAYPPAAPVDPAVAPPVEREVVVERRDDLV